MSPQLSRDQKIPGLQFPENPGSKRLKRSREFGIPISNQWRQEATPTIIRWQFRFPITTKTVKNVKDAKFHVCLIWVCALWRPCMEPTPSWSITQCFQPMTTRSYHHHHQMTVSASHYCQDSRNCTLHFLLGICKYGHLGQPIYLPFRNGLEPTPSWSITQCFQPMTTRSYHHHHQMTVSASHYRQDGQNCTFCTFY